MFSKLKEVFAKFTKKVEKEADEKPKEKRSLLQKITETKISDSKFKELSDTFETELLQNNVAYEVVEAIKSDLKELLVNKSHKRSQLKNIIKDELEKLITKILEEPKQIDLLSEAKKNKPLIIMFIGTNGHGKTTSLAKIAYYLKKNGLSCIFAASDTFRAGSEQQLQEHANKLNIKMIKHKHGADPAAVAFDGKSHCISAKKDVLLIDTAGRQHSNINLMDELNKIKRVVKPNITIFVGESIAGNDAVEQAKSFEEAIGVDAIILTKVDTDDKGGTILSIAYALHKPILFIGTGQKYADLEEFNIKKFINHFLG